MSIDKKYDITEVNFNAIYDVIVNMADMRHHPTCTPLVVVPLHPFFVDSTSRKIMLTSESRYIFEGGSEQPCIIEELQNNLFPARLKQSKNKKKCQQITNVSGNAASQLLSSQLFKHFYHILITLCTS
ncbi:hypothetical protein ACJX0J_031642 [Zea mays]